MIFVAKEEYLNFEASWHLVVLVLVLLVEIGVFYRECSRGLGGQTVQVEGVETQSEFMYLCHVLIAKDCDFDVSIDCDWMCEIFGLWFLVVVASPNASFQRSVELKVVGS